MGKRVWNGRRWCRVGSVIFLQMSFLFFLSNTKHMHMRMHLRTCLCRGVTVE